MRWLRVSTLTCGVVAILCLGVNDLGQWLVVEDALRHSRAIVILGGDPIFRPAEAARLYHAGWAKEVWVPRSDDSGAEAALRQRDLLERDRVPPEAIRLLSGRVRDTVTELHVVARELERAGGGTVILVTSKPHTRRVRFIWDRTALGRLAAVVRYPSDEPYDGRRWWLRGQDMWAVVHETAGLFVAWIHFVRPEARHGASAHLLVRYENA
jgi:uncharacterized SAM-binding protein YcdF (DUF218 family)